MRNKISSTQKKVEEKKKRDNSSTEDKVAVLCKRINLLIHC